MNFGENVGFYCNNEQFMNQFENNSSGVHSHL